MKQELRILMAEDSPADAELEIRELKRAGLHVVHRVVETEQDYRAALAEFRPDLIISDFSMPHFDGMWALALMRELAPDIPFIFVSGTIGEEYAIRALKEGATDYVLKSNLLRLPPAVERALQDKEAQAARRRAEEEVARQRAFLRHVIDLDRNRIFAKDRDGRFALANQAMADAYGSTVEGLIGRANADLTHDKELAERLLKTDREVLDSHREIFIPEMQMVDMAGNVRWFQVLKRPIVSADGTTEMVLSIATDITERKNQELKIARLSRIHEVLSGINSAIVRIRDRDELFQEACRIAVEHGKFVMAWIGMLDEAAQEIIPAAKAGREDGYLDRIKLTIDPETTRNLAMAVEAIARCAPVVCNDIANDGRMRPWRAAALERGYRSTALLPLILEQKAVGVFELYSAETEFFDESEMKLLVDMAGDVAFALDHIAKAEKLDYLAYYDALTGLPNRALFNDRLERQLAAARGHQEGSSIIVLDIERFRHINETLGRQAGDELLRQMGERLKQALQETDVLAYMGGDYFVIASRRAGKGEEAARLVEQILANVSAEPFRVGGDELRIATRAGIGLYPADGASADALLKNAEAALRSAKATGQRYQFYALQMNARVAEQLRLENDLRNATLQEQYVLHYQPRFDFASGRMTGLEALIRWKHPERGMVSPADFIPILEETGMIIEVGRWALRQAALDHARWSGAGLQPPRVAVNVSPAQLRRKDFVDYVKDALGGVDKVADRLDIEITESMLMEDVDGAIGKLQAMQAMGLHIAIDDFGTGYSSLSYLARLPINSLKIDRSFVTQMPKSPEQMAIVSTVISLARALNLKVVAEGVETEEQANLLRLLRCDEAQGYLFGRPMPPDQIEALLAKR